MTTPLWISVSEDPAVGFELITDPPSTFVINVIDKNDRMTVIVINYTIDKLYFH